MFGDGLRRFDPSHGERVEAVRESTGCEGALPESTISKLMIDRGGALWVGGQFRGPSVTDPLGTRFRYLADGEPRNVPGAVAATACARSAKTRRGQWWLGTDSGALYPRHAHRATRWRRSTASPRRSRTPGPAAAARDGVSRAATRQRVWLAHDARPGVDLDTQTSAISRRCR